MVDVVVATTSPKVTAKSSPLERSEIAEQPGSPPNVHEMLLFPVTAPEASIKRTERIVPTAEPAVGAALSAATAVAPTARSRALDA